MVLGALAFGGVARIVSLAIAGWPHPFFVGLGIAELLVPPVVYLAATTLSGESVVQNVDS